MNLLSALPEWFTSWGWIVIVAAVVVAIVVVVLIIMAKRRGSAVEVPEPSDEDESVAEPDADEELAEVDEEEEDFDADEDADGEAPAQPAAQDVQSPARPAEMRTEKAKTNNKTYHIAKRRADNRWQVKMAGGAKAVKLFNTQYEAIDFAKKLAENQEAKIVIHKEDGTFRRLTYHKKK